MIRTQNKLSCFVLDGKYILDVRDDFCPIFHLKIIRSQLDIVFLAVQDSSIGDIVSESVSHF